MTDRLALAPEDVTSTSGWRFSVIPPKQVWARWYRTARAIRRPAGSLALPAIATTATLHFTHVLQHSDSLMAFGLTTLTVGYDAVIAVCRTWQTTARQPQQSTTTIRRAA
ncbi:hypothetical protein [Streptomyces sp. S.PNR 29]|uniref:hypothetical protein n=1 Tax=Streptomyces sp. S.PNR 29 TaxID=2973805 RepID=UPI0025B1BC19|nr:hypothetical protein [Streptomyces sp. S.PNR 29]MDN0198474.1 hypothetical protein [Streptomyces sp. S.PNR 29]